MANAVTGNRYEEGDGNGGGGPRPPRLPRWTRQEILVLIQGKKVAESRGRGGRGGGRAHHTGAAAGAAPPVETKWAAVSSYCRRHGVSRGPVQCRKRWSNLAGDYKKIKEWERRRRGPEGAAGEESFWAMRNDMRRERRLPGFFDREVYDILDGAAEPAPEAAVLVVEKEDQSWRGVGGAGPRPPASVEEEEEESTPLFDSRRTAAADGLFSDSEHEHGGGRAEEDSKEETPPPPPPPPPTTTLATSITGMAGEKQQQQEGEENPEKVSSSRGGEQKRKRSTVGEREEPEEEDGLQGQLMAALERSSRTLVAHLEAQNMNCQLDREQRKEYADSLVGVLGKVADALAKIADKL